MRKSALVMAFVLCITSFNNLVSAKSASKEVAGLTAKSAYEQYIEQYDDYKDAQNEINVLEGGSFIINRQNSTATFTVSVPENAKYLPIITYKCTDGDGGNIQLSLKTDGKYPFVGYENFELYRTFADKEGAITVDDNGNEYTPEQVEVFTEKSAAIRDVDGFCNDDFLLALSKGTHTIELQALDNEVEITGFTLKIPTLLKSYDEIKEEYSGYKNYSGKPIVKEGEDAKEKSSQLIVPLVDRSDPSVKPSDPYKDKLNYIGGTNWKSNGDTVTWEIEVPEDGLYKLSFHFKQTYLQDGISYRTLKIDGEIPYREAAEIPFAYDSGWQYTGITPEKDKLIYLTKGKHDISLTVTLGPLSGFANELKQVVSDLGDTYREIVMITGESPDASRDYDLFVQIPQLEEKLESINERLAALSDENIRITGKKGGSNSTNLKNVIITINQMLNVKYKAHTKVSSLYSKYSSLASWLYEMQDMSLDIDALILTSPGTNYKREVGFAGGFTYTFNRLLSSFADDYELGKSTDKTVNIWCNWGRDQVSALESLINSSFTPSTGLKVNLKITSASIIQAKLSGNGPDLLINNSRSAPVNYAIRSSAYDLTKFSDYNEVIKRFAPSAMTPYTYKGGVYGLPETQSFYMMFVRTDILDELSISVPKTWEEFYLAAKIIALNNMDVAIPYTQVTNDAVNAGVGALTLLPTIALQNGVSIYNNELNSTNFSSAGMLTAAQMWTDLYTKYKLPKTYNFFNRFRTGTIPLAIQDYTNYALVDAAAPEINGRWTIAQIPGVKQENGEINNCVSGSGNAAVILSTSKNPSYAWDFLKWYTSDEIQFRFCKNLESVLGMSGRRATANVEAMKRLGWNEDVLNELLGQWDKLVEIQEIPGSYYVSRSIDQIYWNVVDGGSDCRAMLKKWGAEADNEIKRKIAEYDTDNQ